MGKLSGFPSQRLRDVESVSFVDQATFVVLDLQTSCNDLGKR